MEVIAWQQAIEMIGRTSTGISKTIGPMKERTEIVAAFEALCAEGKPAALATVIAVEGSSYRKPGARMLIAGDGRTWGGVSGGCLERDVARRALGVIETGRAMRCRYETGDDETLAAATSTGCGGTVELLIQRVDAQMRGPIPFFASVQKSRQPITIRTVVRAKDDVPGRSTIVEDATSNEQERPRLLQDINGNEYFVERLVPSQSLVVFGAGPDVVPLVSIAKTLGWHVTIVGSRPATGISQRFAEADAIYVTSSDAPTAGVAIEHDAAVAVMTHNVARDVAILRSLRGPLKYLGVLGPIRRTQRLLSSLPGGRVVGLAPGRLFAPIGLDLGTQTPEEIALSIVAEIQSVVRNASGLSLRSAQGAGEQFAGEPCRT